ncbi:MAG: SDR family oxidoreductase [Bacteroidota bacterium]
MGIGGGIHPVAADIRDVDAMARCLQDADAVIYLAGVSDGRAGKANPALTLDVNVRGFERFVDVVKDSPCRRFLFASTFGVYGYSYTTQLVESMPPDPQEPYSLSKWKAEQILAEIKTDQLTITSLRLAMVFGYSPRMRNAFIVNHMIDQALSTGQIDVMGGRQVRPQLYIRDVARYFTALLEKPADKIAGRAFNACGLNLSLMEVAVCIRQVLGGNIQINQLPAREGEHTFQLNQDLLAGTTGLVPQGTIAEAVLEIQRAQVADAADLVSAFDS